jgi:hypothetical protein
MTSETTSLSLEDLKPLSLVLSSLSSLLLLLLLQLLPLCALLALARADGTAWVWAWVRDLVYMSCPHATVNC